MTIATGTKRHAFLSPAHNAWSVWTTEGTQTLTNPGSSHRVLETLAFAIDTMVSEGWTVLQIFVEQGTPTLVFFEKDNQKDSG